MTNATELNLTFGHSEKTLSDAFDILTRKKHWKDPISTWVPEKLYNVYNSACRFYTATNLKKWMPLRHARPDAQLLYSLQERVGT